MAKGIWETIIVATGFAFGLWVHFLYTEGGLSLVLAQGWIGLVIALALIGGLRWLLQRHRRN